MDSSNEFSYFAYGSNMSTKRLVARLPSARSFAVGFLAGYKLTFDKASKDGSGKCDCEYTGNDGDRVYGVIFKVTHKERAALDRFEGAGKGYEPLSVRVETATGAVYALTYVATKKQRGLQPYHWYKQHVLVGAREANLPEDYVRAIEAVASIDDPDSTRTEHELRPYSAA
ncbi:gamma-glutamylcyclotransferase [Paraburkholderia bannensis]|uniref:gamma-glutamylcyclotransferase family protein n=1 Tax=Paraburkholderia tropica TaxID=92647 RepID=UPI0009430201|nr:MULTISPECIES: gamma-glutamylcyclotransferase family protein [Paraburkholderia]RQM44262.1 gamma-glutamylcyclotransferase [Paraburkholderia bannensis]RQN34148.1 gamma-glutamylcyclotransferase [Paraburkholderia tropica]